MNAQLYFCGHCEQTYLVVAYVSHVRDCVQKHILGLLSRKGLLKGTK